jgi:hypothetical protein
MRMRSGAYAATRWLRHNHQDANLAWVGSFLTSPTSQRHILKAGTGSVPDQSRFPVLKGTVAILRTCPRQPQSSPEAKRCRRVSFPFLTAAGTERRGRPNPLRTLKGCCHGTAGIIGLVREVT